MSRRLLLTAVLVGLPGVAAAAWLQPARFWASLVVWLVFLQTLALGSLFLPALERLVRARWSVPLRRVPERTGTLLAPVAVLALAALGALPRLYPGWPAGGAKGAWLSPAWFAARTALAALLGLLAVAVLVGGSLRLDRTRDPRLETRLRVFAPVYMAIFALVASLAAFDWVGGLTPAWYSDLLGVYLGIGGILAGLAATTLGVLGLRGRGRLPGVRPDHLYSLGGLLFAFTAFWAYLAYSQYLLMWYGNLPDEAGWYQLRLGPGWRQVTYALAAVRFLVPFAALLPRAAKADPARLRWVAGVVLAGHLLDLHWLVGPALGRGVTLGWPEAAFLLAFGGGAGLWCRALERLGADQPIGDPALPDALEFRL